MRCGFVVFLTRFGVFCHHLYTPPQLNFRAKRHRWCFLKLKESPRRTAFNDSSVALNDCTKRRRTKCVNYRAAR